MATVSIANTTANVSGKTVTLAERDHTITGSWTFSRSPSAPFTVTVGSAVVTNLDADKLDGLHGPVGAIVGISDIQTLTNKTLTSPTIATPTITSPTINTSILSTKLIAGICEGRLTLTSGTPVTSGDVSAVTNVFWTPFNGTNIALYDGTTNWTLLPFVETTLALGTLTNDLPYDVFAFNNSGTLALEALAWSTKTARATALVFQDGVLSKTGALTRRYLGTFHTTSTTTTEDSASKRYLSNHYNKHRRPLLRRDTTGSWAYTLTTIRQANAAGVGTANQVSAVIGWADTLLDLQLNAAFKNSTGTVDVGISFGEDSTTTFSTNAVGGYGGSTSINAAIPVSSTLKIYPAVGAHFYAWLENSTASGTTSFFGSQVTNVASGITGFIEG